MTKVIDAADAAAAGRSGHGVNDEGNTENKQASDAKLRFKSEEEIVSKDNQIELTKAEMSEVKLENQRLRIHLERLTKDYQTLQTQFQDIIVQQDATKRGNNNNVTTSTPVDISSLSSQQDIEEHDISLRLGRTTSSSSKKEVMVMNKSLDNIDDERGLALGLDSCSKPPFEVSKTDRRSSTEPLTNNTSTDTSFDQEEKKDDIMGETWPPPKMMKRSAEDEIDSQHNNGKRARVSVRARCDTPTMNDGCQWRKYGQKIAKGNPCPRAYYRCTVAPSCPVRKQVQRCAEDMSILITTYEGTHNHPLAAAATAMASTTSAAASMLLSGSSTSSRHVGLGQPTTSATTTSAGLHGLTYNLPNGTTLSSQPSRPQQFYIQNNSHISSSSPNTHPTITLDLTTSNPFTTPFTNPHFNRFSSSTSNDPSQLFSSKSTSLNFSSIDHNNNNNNPTAASLSWATSNHSNNALGYRNIMYPQNNRNNHHLGLLTLGSSRFPQENIYQSFMQKPNNSAGIHINHHQQTQQLQQQQQQQQPQLPDHIAAATKAITADPSFQTALAAALTSIIGGTGSGGAVATHHNSSEKMQQVNRMENNLGQKMKWVDHQKGSNNGCGSSYLSSTSSAVSNAQTSGLMLLQPPSAVSKSKSTSPCENKQDHNTS